MTLEKTLLQKAHEWRPAPGEREMLSVVSDDGIWCARLTADRCEELGVALWDVRLERIDSPIHLGHEQLVAWAERIAQLPACWNPWLLWKSTRSAARANSQRKPTLREGRQLYYEILISRTGKVDVQRLGQAAPHANRLCTC